MFFEATVDGSDWWQLPVTPIAGGTAVFQTAAGFLGTVSVKGLGQVRARLGGPVLGAVTVVGTGVAL